MEKLIRNGQVAVIIGNGHGENWSTGACGSEIEHALYCPRLARAILGESDETVATVVKALFPNLKPFCGPDLKVEWVPVGVRFFITEYDGKESVWREDSIHWYTA
jgi:hypothetical protein